MRQGRGGATLWGIGALAAAGWACETARNPGGIQRDLIPPTIALSKVKDTQDISGGLQFTVSATDNLSLKDIRLTYSGGYFAQTDTVFLTQTTSITIPVTITFPKTSGAGGNIKIIGRATDGAGNFTEDSIVIFLVNVQALKVYLLAPATGAVASTGKSIPVQVAAAQKSGVRKVGFLVVLASAVTNPTTPPNDSILYATPYADSVNFTDTLNVVATTGTFTVTGFAEDSGGRRGTSVSVTVTVQSAANDVTPPTVSHTVSARVEVSDSVTVHATDPSGISWMGLEILNTAGTVLRFDSVNVAAGNLTDITRKFSLNLAGIITTFPASVVVRGYACDGAAARNCAFSQTSTVVSVPTARLRVFGAAQVAGFDTIIVVAGITKPLPAGGTIVDAIFDAHANANTGELYLTNPTLSRVEIFQVANTSFVSGGIPTAGPQPWGIALWPRDTVGNYADTIVVANAGGTELSIVDVTTGVRRLLWRQDLPDFLIETYKVTQAPGFKTQIVEYNISDRPQYVATVCRPAGGTLCSSDSVFALYSTTPEPSNPSPFTGRATLRMEKLKNTQDTTQLFAHLFWEIGQGFPSSGTDTLRVVMRRGLPYNQTKVILSACAGVTVDLSSFGLGDTTFARNSGNFTHGFFGEGGKVSAAFARVMSYTTKGALRHDSAATYRACQTTPGGPVGAVRDSGSNDVDLGMSPAVDVNDFISNTATKVASIATNFNGGTNLVRADSIYVLDEGLRLKGTSCTLSTTGTGCVTGAPGMDMNYNHAFAAGQPGTPTFCPLCATSPNDRLSFAARPDGNIDVFDTFFYGKVATVPVRDPILGPLRVARDASGNQLLFGITAKGLVMVRLPAITNPNPAARRAGSP